jgi:uncharacterized protein (DUF2147 family)
MQQFFSVSFLAFIMGAFSLHAQSSTILGDWREPTGSVIRISQCDTGLCLRVLLISPKAPAKTDIYNPDAKLRARPLCNLEVGSHFQLRDSTHAINGILYDAKSGNTYGGALSVEGDTLKMRGYIGLPLFGKTETWLRVREEFTSCAGNAAP